MKKINILALALVGQALFSQVGVNTSSPMSTMDIAAKTNDGSKPEGLIAPRLTGDQIKLADDLYTSNQKGTIIYALSAVGTTSPKTLNINAEGYYFFDGSVWQKIVTPNNDINIYKDNGTLVSNRVVALSDKTINFSSTATTGTSHFQVDGTTLNVDAVNNNVGIGTAAPTNKLDINSATAGALKITDGTQAEGRFMVSDANGVGTWRESTGSATIINSTVGPITPISNAGSMSYTGSSAVVTTPGYYIVSPRLILDKTPSACSNFVAYNLSKSATAPLVSQAFAVQDVHMAPGSGPYDFIYTSNIAYLTAGTYYMMVRYGGGAACTTYKTRNSNGENAFSLTLLK